MEIKINSTIHIEDNCASPADNRNPQETQTPIDHSKDVLLDNSTTFNELLRVLAHNPEVSIAGQLEAEQKEQEKREARLREAFGEDYAWVVEKNEVGSDDEAGEMKDEKQKPKRRPGARQLRQGYPRVAMIEIGQNARVEVFNNGYAIYDNGNRRDALGALHAYGYIYPIEIVRMTIIQPRLDNISTYECSREVLEAWGESIKPTAKMAYEGKGEQKAGDWCRFCRAKPVCRACKEEALSLCREEFLDLDAGAFAEDPRAAPADVEESDTTAPYTPDLSAPTFKQPGLVSLDELTEILPTLNRISSWIESVFAYISSEAINHGVPIKGYKVVEGRSKRIFTDTKAVVATATQNGYTDLYKQQLISLTEFEKMMGKKKFAELLGDYVAKPPGKLALVPESDPRPPVDLSNGVVGVNEEFEVLDND